MALLGLEVPEKKGGMTRYSEEDKVADVAYLRRHGYAYS